MARLLIATTKHQRLSRRWPNYPRKRKPILDFIILATTAFMAVVGLALLWTLLHSSEVSITRVKENQRHERHGP